ncbi:S41 family peptidase [Shewanella sp. SR44-3]|uniref:S41 family peptidase n=1 Tax=unclassified Shewanella TaxID=196818 RepID=UPI0015FC6DDA|nr:S41 family peptidase [Shewanella sp. SR44-3]MBB1268492.1 S41 family peptidase [Shewanella sp. SR44-3]
MGQYFRYLLCFILGAIFALSISLSSSEHAHNHIKDYDYPLLMDVIETIETYYVKPLPRQELIEAAIAGIFTHLDPYSDFLNHSDYQSLSDVNKGSYFGFGFEVATDDNKIVIISPFSGSPAAKVGIQAGDIIVKLNGYDIDANNLNQVLKDIKRHSQAKEAIGLTLQRIDHAALIDVSLQPSLVQIEAINARLIDNEIGYIHLASFQEDTTTAIRQQAIAWQNHKLTGVILDLRNNPGGLLDQAIGIADLFLDKGLIVSTKGRFFDANEAYYASSEAIFSNVPMVVLINKGSASASEVLAAALQENNRATLMGEKSFGKGTIQSLIPMLNQGNAMKLTIAKYSTPKGNDIHSKGIEPDIKIEIAAVTAANNMPIIDKIAKQSQQSDNELDTAIAWITTNN